MTREKTIQEINRILETGIFPDFCVDLLRDVIRKDNPNDFFLETILRRMKEDIELLKKYGKF